MSLYTHSATHYTMSNVAADVPETSLRRWDHRAIGRAQTPMEQAERDRAFWCVSNPISACDEADTYMKDRIPFRSGKQPCNRMGRGQSRSTNVPLISCSPCLIMKSLLNCRYLKSYSIERPAAWKESRLSSKQPLVCLVSARC